VASSASLRSEPRRFSDVALRGYARRRPESTLLYKIVEQHLETFLAEAREKHDKPLPRYVESELRAYLSCGILSYGLLRALCRACGAELVVAFSCKRRGICPSCNARRMCNTAANLVDRVFPDVPVRQIVLTTPFEIRFLLARRADAFGRLIKIFGEEVLGFQRDRARQLGIKDARGGGVSFPQRFGSAIQINTHVHGVFCDGVFTFAAQGERADAERRAEFHPLPPPESGDLTALCRRIHDRFRRWLVRNGLLRLEADEASNETPELSALDACTRASVGIGQLTHVESDGGDEDDAADELQSLRPRKGGGRYFGEAMGFGLHAGVSVPAGNAFGRELLLRYCARPPFALERLSLLPDGRIAYRLKKPWRRDQTHRVMTPTQLLARLSALIPPPRSPLARTENAGSALDAYVHFRRMYVWPPAP
jgi:hypothetical protein